MSEPVAVRWRWKDADTWILSISVDEHPNRVIEPLYTTTHEADLLAALKGLLDEVDVLDVRLSSPAYEAQKAIAKADGRHA